MHSDAMYYRNWPTDDVILALFNTSHLDLNATGREAFMAQLYFSQLGQGALCCRRCCRRSRFRSGLYGAGLLQARQIQEWRATNNFGILFCEFSFHPSARCAEVTPSPAFAASPRGSGLKPNTCGCPSGTLRDVQRDLEVRTANILRLFAHSVGVPNTYLAMCST